MKMMRIQIPAYCFYRFLNQNTCKYCCSYDNRIITCNDDEQFPKLCPLEDVRE